GDTEEAEARVTALGEGDDWLDRVRLEGAFDVRFERESDEPHREVVVRRPLEGGVLHFHFRVPEALFEDYQTAGDDAEVYARLLDRRDFVSGAYVAIYSAAVL